VLALNVKPNYRKLIKSRYGLTNYFLYVI